MRTCCEDKEEREISYKDVVIVGNGPSGICLSYMLAGNWPYYTGESHPGDEMLSARLRYNVTGSPENSLEEERLEKSGSGSLEGGLPKERRVLRRGRSQIRPLVQTTTRHKLENLSSGLEGRAGGRPLALLMDQLQHPCVDAGLDIPSLITFKSVNENPDHRVIDHVVLGKGLPGGAWQTMDPNVMAISLSRWMSLPGLDFKQWVQLLESEQNNLTEQDTLLEKLRGANTGQSDSRVPVGIVAVYYKDYVKRQGLERYFRCGTTVTCVKPAPATEESYDWIVQGIENKSRQRFEYRCKKVVLATGTTDLSNQLGLPGEDSLQWVTHDLNDLEARLDCITKKINNSLEAQADPVLVIGAGLSAADAIMAARCRGIPVLHAFRDSSGEWDRETEKRNIMNGYDRLQWLPDSIYPEYHKIFEMMADNDKNYPLYRSLPGYTLVNLGLNGSEDLKDDGDGRFVTLCSPKDQLHTFQISIIAILIGYRPNLSYLKDNGVGLGRNESKPIDNKTNPIEVDNVTYEIIKAPRKGLYALGPLVGDNFVRFILGGAFGSLVHIQNTIELPEI
ncbi:oxidative stress-induced growth inhibitor 1-like [Prorops nasuta]|uniref:oxidative stress-induced growth inhibitor 1-like n=1 Tax=Prorops nasuta TaxID=863751 RepID=UPI0034CF897B